MELVASRKLKSSQKRVVGTPPLNSRKTKWTTHSSISWVMDVMTPKPNRRRVWKNLISMKRMRSTRMSWRCTSGTRQPLKILLSHNECLQWNHWNPILRVAKRKQPYAKVEERRYDYSHINKRVVCTPIRTPRKYPRRRKPQWAKIQGKGSKSSRIPSFRRKHWINPFMNSTVRSSRKGSIVI